MPELGVFGKIPAKGDFIRHNVASDAARSLDQWVQESNDALRGAQGSLPTAPVRMVLSPAGTGHTVVATLCPSQDKVGRNYPLVIFATFPTGKDDFSQLPVSWGSFLDASVDLAQRASTLDLETLKTAVAHLPMPTEGQHSEAKQLCARTLAHPLVTDLHNRLYGENSEAFYYAYQTFLMACQDAAKADVALPSMVLDCPLQVDVDLFLWLELCRRSFEFAPTNPGYFWVEEQEPRLLLSLGAPPQGILQFLANPELSNQRLWPLTTTRQPAVAAAKKVLDASIGDLNGAPLSQLLEGLIARASTGSLR